MHLYIFWRWGTSRKHVQPVFDYFIKNAYCVMSNSLLKKITPLLGNDFKDMINNINHNLDNLLSAYLIKVR